MKTAAVCLFAAVTVFSAHAEDAPYEVWAGGRPVEVQEIAAPVHTLKGKDARPYWYAQFDSPGPVEVRVKAKAGTDAVKVRPGKVAVRTAPGEVMFSVVPPCQLSVEPNGRHNALILAANLPETDVPDARDPNVVWIGPGRHRRNLELVGDQTLYLAPGAILEGCVRGIGTNMTVRGRGALNGLCWGHLEGPGEHAVHLEGTHITVRDIALIGSWTWCLVFDKASDVLVDNVKILGGHVLNDDGIDICRSSKVTIRNTFIRAQDDAIAPKWWCEDLLVEKCVLWVDVANAFRVGYECTPNGARGFRNHAYRNIDILHLPIRKTTPEEFWAHCAIFVQPSNETQFENLLFEDIRFDSVERGDILLNVKTLAIDRKWNTSMEAGRLRGCTLRNIRAKHLFGPETMCVYLEAKDASHGIEGVVLENVTGLGRVSAVRTDKPTVTSACRD